jgi:type IV pilus assembly protein PilM
VSDEKQSIWKKEISFRRKKPAAEPVSEALTPAAPSVAPEPVAAPLVAQPEPVAAPPVALPPAPVAQPVLGAPAVAAPPVQQVSQARPEQPDAAVAASGPSAAEDDKPAAERSVRASGPVEEAGGGQAPSPSSAMPLQPPAPAPLSDETVLPAPGPEVPAPAPAPAPDVPTPLPEPQPKPPAPEPTFPPPAPEPTFPPPAPEPPFPPAPAPEPPAPSPAPTPPLPEAAAPAAEAPTAAAEAVPFWKRDLFGGKSKQPKQPKQSKSKGEAKPPKAEEPKAAKRPKAKREKAEKVSRRGGKKLVGLKIGASQLAAARTSNNGSVELHQVVRDDLEQGIIVGGELRDPDALSEALRAFFKKHKLPRRGVRLGIANNRIGVRTFEISGIEDAKQLANAVRFRAQEALPIPIDEAVLDYQVLSEVTNEEGVTTRRILLVVAYRELINHYLAACRKAGITLMGIDLEAFALLRALAPPQDGSNANPSAALVAVAIGHDRSTFAVSDGRVCEFTRVLDWGGAALNVAVARTLDLAPSQAEPVKRALSLHAWGPVPGLTPEQVEAAREAVRRHVQSFARELVSSLQFYQSQPGSLGIGEIVLTGGTAHLPGLAEELQRLIGVSVRVGNPLARVNVGRKFREPDQLGSLAVAIGLAIED